MKRISKIYRELKEFHAKGMEPNTRKKAKPSSTKSSLGDISKRADSFKIVRSRKSSAQLRNKAGLRGLSDGMENMCCKNCGDMFGKPTKENKSCQYNAYDPKGKNWTEAKKIRITPKMQRRALASPAAKAKPKSQVTLKKAPWDKKNEAFDFKVNIDGFPEMFMSGNSPSEVKAHLRKLVKQPSMIKGVDRVTAHDKKKHHRDKMKESVDLDEGKMKQLHMYMDQGKSAAWIASKMKLDLKTVKALMGEGTMGDMPEEGTPEATQKAKSMTPGQEGVMDFLRNVGNTVMYGRGNKPKQMNVRKKVDTNRGSTSGQQNSLASRINFGGKYGNK